jgi:hypothetical protein
LQEPFGATTGLPIHGVNDFHPRSDDAAATGDLAFLEVRSVIARTIPRRLISALMSALAEAPAVAPLGPRQVGKTTLALELANTQPAVYLHLEPSGN